MSRTSAQTTLFLIYVANWEYFIKSVVGKQDEFKSLLKRLGWPFIANLPFCNDDIYNQVKWSSKVSNLNYFNQKEKLPLFIYYYSV